MEYIIEQVKEEDAEVVSEGDVLVEPAYSQILEQIQKMKHHSLKTNDMTFQIPSSSQKRVLKLIQTNSNGSCLFLAVAHQLFGYTDEWTLQKSATSLRREAVKHIKKHYDDFKIQLKNSVYDRQICDSVELSGKKMDE